MPVKSPLYDGDFFAWSLEQAKLLRGKARARRHRAIAEEIESMGRAEKRELISRLSVLLLPLLQWRYQPEKRSPSLRPLLPQPPASAYRDAALEAVAETGLARSTVPDICPWTVGQVCDHRFWPG